ncbi:MAG: FAD-dependent thymidylate synthase [Rickettsiales bacterium]|jgi:thymidylate synthase (FAD)|nr:FAD-dependent thymidylate synthase [Rickettsiales bacterium]
MKIIEQSHSILSPATNDEWTTQAKLIESAGRTAYKSEDKISEDSSEKFIKMISTRNHGAVLEFGNMVVKFITDRGVSHEIVRHRIASFLQESTRYCNYGKDKFGKEITVIKPSTWDDWAETARNNWTNAVRQSEKSYLAMIDDGVTPQQARAVLPNSLKTEINVGGNFREWRHIFQLRAISRAAHPDIRALMIPLYEECRTKLPCVFDMGDIQR